MTKQTVYLNNIARKSGFRLHISGSLPFKLTTVGEVIRKHFNSGAKAPILVYCSVLYIYLLKLKAYKLFENGDANLSWLLFLKKPTCLSTILKYTQYFCFRFFKFVNNTTSDLTIPY